MSFSGHTEEGIINVDQDVTSQLTSSKPSSLTIDLDVDAIKIEDNVFLDPQNVNDDENHFSIQGNVHVENNLWVGNLHDFSASVNQRGGINFIYEPYSHRHQQGMFIHQQSKKTSVLLSSLERMVPPPCCHRRPSQSTFSFVLSCSRISSSTICSDTIAWEKLFT
eukprot:Awhi_evm2s14804